MEDYPALHVERKTGQETFLGATKDSRLTLLSFWQWSASDLVGNALRGILAEYIVSMALGAEHGTREEWDAYDVLSKDGIKVEVKSASYIQSWEQKKTSAIQFSIRQTQAWDSNELSRSSESRRQADVYVFCLLTHRDQQTINPMDLSQWAFYVLPTKVLNQELGNQKTLGLTKLEKLGPIKVEYKQLCEAVEQAAKN